ncbi:hypothetical protein BU23DRAFT_582274 [Bimuria novae-zelandiae CBS 107.79]|uniref:Myb-like domain-containing protein n=1 Tax=Bimuria novae-zelandiae CBS 107.79 TaxID=1447943 RepID=A0A6A5UYV3_9PLEO|nr:hypothetical protein BU23DRAFT_582274 [Bimuria novae-zelandiae CBS 107.79]
MPLPSHAVILLSVPSSTSLNAASLLTILVRAPSGQDPLPIVDINLLIEPRGSESPASKKSSISVASASTGGARPHPSIPASAAYNQPPAYANASPAHIAAAPAYVTSSPGYGPIPAYAPQGGPVLPAISELQRHQEPGPPPPPQFRPLYPGATVTSMMPQGSTGMNGSPPSQMLKRATSQTPLPDESPAKKQSKWTPEEDNLTIELRGQGMKWDDIAKRLPGRSSISCRLRYQNYLEKRAVWDEEKKNKLARLYARFKDQMWQKVATEMGIPWRSAESMHWQLGEQEMSARANAPVFQLHPSATGTGLNSPPTGSVVPAPVSGQPPPPSLAQSQGPPSHGFTPANAPHLMPYAQPPPPQQQQQQQQQQQYHQPPPLPPPTHSSHQRSGSISSQGRMSNSSFSRRRARNSVPPQLGPTLPQIHPQSEADLISGARTAPAPETSTRREGEESLGEAFGKRKREDDGVQSLRAEGDSRSPGGRSPDRVSQRSGTGSVKSLKRSAGDADDREQPRPEPPATTA